MTQPNWLTDGLGKVGNDAENLGSNILGGIKGVLGINSPAATMVEAMFYVAKACLSGLKKSREALKNHLKMLATP